MKLWEKNVTEFEVEKQLVEKFTVGRDKQFDLLLAPYDVKGSLAHAEMLCAIGILTNEEWMLIKGELLNIQTEIVEERFKMLPHVEDIHSQIEFMLTEKLGDLGKKIHTGRSRNDQVLLDIKLYLRNEINGIDNLMKQLFDVLLFQAEKHKDVLMPGYTHLQVAMPSSFGLWFSAFAESLIDDREMLSAAKKIINKNPLGSGAGYGSSFPLDRSLTTKLLAFDDLNYNVVYAQMTRGKSEKIFSMMMANVAQTLSKLSMDICLYMNQNFGFVSFPDYLTTGSSIMPHKKNPDIFELIRGKCNRLQALPNELTMLQINLPSGYHRELQLTKEIIFPAIEELKACLSMMIYAIPKMIINKNILKNEIYNDMFSVEEVNKLVQQQVPFRDAYKIVGHKIEAKEFTTDKKVRHTHEGSIGNLCLKEIKEKWKN